MTPDVPDFKEYRKRKQRQADQDLAELLKDYKTWLARHTNLREKVRAKHIFAKKTDCALEDLVSPPWSRYFEDWLSFDYVTIIGSRLFDMYVKENASHLTPAKIQLSGLILTATLEPYQVIRKENKAVFAISLLDNEKRWFTGLSCETDKVAASTSKFLVRFIQSGFENRVISPIIPLAQTTSREMEGWKQVLSVKEKKDQRFRFLKENGVKFLTYAEKNDWK